MHQNREGWGTQFKTFGKGWPTRPIDTLSTYFLEALPCKPTTVIIDENHIVNNLGHGSNISGMDAETVKT